MFIEDKLAVIANYSAYFLLAMLIPLTHSPHFSFFPQFCFDPLSTGLSKFYIMTAVLKYFPETAMCLHLLA